MIEALDGCGDVTLVGAIGNVGDELIAAGAHVLLDAHVRRHVALNDLCAVRGRTAVLMGGGAFSRSYHEVMPWALRLAQRRFERVIVLPSSFDAGVDAVRDALAQTRAIVFAREPRSYDAIRGLCDARLAMDCAAYVDYSGYRDLAAAGVLQAFRTDAEAPEGFIVPEGNDDLSVTSPSLDAFLARIAAHEEVRTDRAHVMIAAALMGRRVRWAAARTPKVQALASWMLDGLDVRPLAPRARVNATTPRRDRTSDALRRLAGRTTVAERPGSGAPRITAVVVQQDREELTLGAVASLTEETRAPMRVLVVDNNSDGAGRDRLAEGLRGHEAAQLILHDRNLGCAGGCAAALAHVDTELVFLLDSDAVVLPHAVDLLLAELDAHPEAVAAGPTVVWQDGHVQCCGGSVSRPRHGILDFHPDHAGEDPAAVSRMPSSPCDWIPHCAVLVRTETLRAHPIDPGYAAYFEDNDFNQRVAGAHPHGLRRVPAALCLHRRLPAGPHGVRSPPRARADRRAPRGARAVPRPARGHPG